MRYDLRGCGRSAKPNTPHYYLSKKFAEDFAAVVAEFNVTKPVRRLVSTLFEFYHALSVPEA